jgi:BMFP domain-containing protein YqiC
MQSENRFFDDLAKLVNGAAGTIAGVGREVESNARERAKEWIGGMNFVSREEFDAVKAMAAAAREENEALKARLDALEGKAPVSDKAPVSTRAKVGRPKKPDAGVAN